MEETIAAITDVFAKETQRHEELRGSEKCDEYDKQVYQNLNEGKINEVNCPLHFWTFQA